MCALCCRHLAQRHIVQPRGLQRRRAQYYSQQQAPALQAQGGGGEAGGSGGALNDVGEVAVLEEEAGEEDAPESSMLDWWGFLSETEPKCNRDSVFSYSK